MKKTPLCKRSFFGALCTLDLSRTKATRAIVNGVIATVNYSLYLADVRLPGSVGLTVRVRNVVTKGNALTADTAFSHFTPPKSDPFRSNFI